MLKHALSRTSNLSLDKLPLEKLPLEKLPLDKRPLEKLTKTDWSRAGSVRRISSERWNQESPIADSPTPSPQIGQQFRSLSNLSALSTEFSLDLTSLSSLSEGETLPLLSLDRWALWFRQMTGYDALTSLSPEHRAVEMGLTLERTVENKEQLLQIARLLSVSGMDSAAVVSKLKGFLEPNQIQDRFQLLALYKPSASLMSTSSTSLIGAALYDGQDRELLAIAVDDEQRGHGYGRFLLASVLHQLMPKDTGHTGKGASQVSLFVHHRCQSAIELYKQAGGKKVCQDLDEFILQGLGELNGSFGGGEGYGDNDIEAYDEYRFDLRLLGVRGFVDSELRTQRIDEATSRSFP